jgi:pyrimidine operon attenuation protein/uracil phosphoribosyltransferase
MMWVFWAGASAIQKEFLLKLALTRVTTRLVLRGKKVVKLCLVTVKTMCRVIANAVALNCESFTRCSHPHFRQQLLP